VEEQRFAASGQLVDRLLRLAGVGEGDAPDRVSWESFLGAVRALLADVDQERYLLERSLETSSAEVLSLHERLRASAHQLDGDRERLRAANLVLQAILDASTDGIVVVADDGRVAGVNRRFAHMCGLTTDDFEGRDGRAVLHSLAAQLVDPTMFVSTLDRHWSAPDAVSFDTLALVDGRVFECESSPSVVDAEIVGRVWSFRDITDRLVSESALSEAQEAFRHAFDDAPIGMALVAPGGDILRVNRSFAAMLGCRDGALIGTQIADLTHPDDREISGRNLERLTTGEIDSYRVEKRYRTADGTWLWVALSVSMVRDAAGEAVYTIGQVEDITERKKLTDQLRYDANHDPLTGLPNRASLAEQTASALEEAARHRGQVAVLFIDLDNFKAINDGLGHTIGDRLLIIVARRLHNTLRPQDAVARFGGDEFVVLCPKVTSAKSLDVVVQRLIATVAEPIAIEGYELFVTATIGIALSERGDTPETLLRHADTAMYQAKHTARGSAVTFQAHLGPSAVAILKTGTDLHRALERNELHLHYQPIVNLQTGVVHGYEALLRWCHPERGQVGPDEFIPLAEDNGLIVPIGEWVLETACCQGTRWNAGHTEAGPRPALLMNVNVSARQVTDPMFAKRVSRIVDRSGIDPSAVCLELTENTLMSDTPNTLKTLRAVRNEGIHLSIDDFGTGYSSLSYLKRLPVESLKIDRSFINGLGHEPEDINIVHAIVTLGQSMGLTVVAEGVETPTQLHTLTTLRCPLAQGYLFAKPQPADHISNPHTTTSFRRPKPDETASNARLRHRA